MIVGVELHCRQCTVVRRAARCVRAAPGTVVPVNRELRGRAGGRASTVISPSTPISEGDAA
ncbi:hypothetical protein CH274_08830 [Rhodococcus sp. 06-418-5]|nr:hypothetical protein NY08_1035 [Rhodococcus sp. B7740]OZC83034.1 hypothetical protein CH274_08830 [Rhodococcus sp. 06-418-5]